MSKNPVLEAAPGDAALGRALALVRDLRARCPWDHAQTRDTLRPYLVEEALEEKMWRRHPHLFADSKTPDHEGWERVKKRERGARSRTLRGLPDTLPPLLMAYRLQERAAGVGFDWPDAKGPLEKVKEELAELEGETGSG